MSILDQVSFVPCHPKNRGGARPVSAIRYLVFHYTGNDGDRASNNAFYYRDNIVQASAHYFVDDDHIYQSVEDTGIAWAVGGKKWSDCARTGGGSLFLTANNYNTLSIELCDTRRDGQLMATEATLERAVELGRALMEKYGIPVEWVIRHFDVSGKHCPAYFMDSERWAAFKERLKEDEAMDLDKLIADMTPEQACKIVEKAQRHREGQPLPTGWDAAGELKEAMDMGITDGTRPMCMASRLETAVMVKRARKGA